MNRSNIFIFRVIPSLTGEFHSKFIYQGNVMLKIEANDDLCRGISMGEKVYRVELSRESVIGRFSHDPGTFRIQCTSPRVTITERRERKGERMSTAASPRWDEVPAVAGVGSIQKRQQSAPPYYVFSSDPYPSFQPPLLLVARIQPATPACYSPLTTLHTHTHPLPRPPPSHGSIAPERFTASRKIPAIGSSLARSALIEDDFFLAPPPRCFLPCTLLFPHER